ncbi:MAG: glycosyltransferase family 4 protein [bacterium]
MKIAIFTPTFLPKCSGAEIFHHNLARQLVGMGHAPVVLLPRSLHRRLETEGWNPPYETVPFPANTWSYFKYSASLALWLNRRILSALQRKHGFDVWHTVVLSPTGFCFANWQTHTGVPGLVRAVGDDVQAVSGTKSHLLFDNLIRQWIPRAQCLVSLSHDMSAELRQLGVPAEKIELMPNAVHRRRFTLASKDPRVREALRIPTEAFLFLCVARNHPQKDLPTLLGAFQILANQSAAGPVHLAIVGRGVPALQSLVDSMGLKLRVHLLEIMPDASLGVAPELPPQKLIELYLAADAFVLSSHLEGFSSALLEAMSAGLPVVATSAPGIVDQVQHGREALLSPVGSPEMLAESMQKIHSDRNLAHQLGVNAGERSQNFSWENVALKYTRLYERLIKEAHRA